MESSDNGPPPLSYKAIPEKDLEEEATRPKSLVKSKPSTPQADGADEKMLDEKEMEAKNEKSPSEKQNGDTKLDIGDLKQAFVGLTKEELLKFAEDPFWVRLRWFLFITFWLLWAAMLVGAVMIIYAAPKCDLPPPRTWAQEGPLARSDDITSKDMEALQKQGVKGVVVPWPDDAYAPIDEAHPLVKLLKETSGVNVIIELNAAASDVWFGKSEAKEANLADYYIWRPAKGSSDDPKPPNNWLTQSNTTSWKYSSMRKEYYYAPSGRPHLNFRNPNVVSEFNSVLKKWLGLGAKGIQLKNAALLLVDDKFEDELIRSPSVPNVVLTDYLFYTHTKTEHLNELGPLLKEWNAIVKNKTETGPLIVAEDLHNVDGAYKVNQTWAVDLPVVSNVFSGSRIDPEEVVKKLDYAFKSNGIEWPMWKYNGSDALDLVTFLLPGVPLVDKGRNISEELLKIRNSPSIMRGSFEYYAVANKTVFAFVRVTSGNPGILVAYNPSEQSVVVDFPSEIKAVSSKVTVQMLSSQYNETDVSVNIKQEAAKIPISANSAIVLSYVPKQK